MLGPQPIQRVRRVYRFKGLKLIGVVLVLAVLLQAIIMIGQSLFLRSTKAERGFVEHEFPTDFLILRHEKVLTPPMAGQINLAVSAGYRVRRDDLLFEIIDPRSDKQLDPQKRQELIEYWRRVADLDRVIRGIEQELRIYRSKQSGIGQRIIKPQDRADMEREIRRLQVESSRLKTKKSSLLESMHRSDIGDYITYYRCVFADEAGFFWPALDGGEELPVGESYVPNIDDFQRNYQTTSPVLNREVQKDQPIGKLITNWDITLVALVKDNNTIYRPKEMQHCHLTLADGRELNLEFIQKLPAPSGEFWFFRDSSLDQELLKKRRIRGLLKARRTFGMRVPISSLKKDGQKWFIMVSKKGNRCEIPVKVVDYDYSWAIIEGLDEGAIILYH